MRKYLFFIGFLLFIPSLIFNIFLYRQIKSLEQGILVLGVIDGDTLVLEGKVRLRLRHVDAPELEFCGGKEAKDLLQKKVKGKKVVLKEQILDQRGRPIALVYTNSHFVNLEMAESGWVRYHHDQSSQSQVLKLASQRAKNQHKGIFSPQCYQEQNLENPHCLIKGNIDKGTGAKKYYFPGCAQYKFTIVEKDIGEDWFCNEDEAQKAGFEKSKTCFDKNYLLQSNELPR